MQISNTSLTRAEWLFVRGHQSGLGIPRKTERNRLENKRGQADAVTSSP